MRIIFSLLAIALLLGCDDTFLDIKSESNLVIPKSVEDVTGLMNNTVMFNGVCTELGTVGGDEFIVRDGLLHTLTVPWQRNAYIWADEVYEGQTIGDWNNAYQRILYCNIALETLDKLNAEEIEEARIAKGSALFYRAYSHYLLQQQFGMPYVANSAQRDLGIPLKVESDVTLRSVRSTVEETYNQIIEDLKTAVILLPTISENRYSASKSAAYALFAKVYLDMQDYDKALTHVDLCLGIQNRLLDYNDIPIGASIPFSTKPIENVEIIYYASMLPSAILRTSYSISPEVLELYSDDDLRKEVYFTRNVDGRILFKGSYLGFGNGIYFVGLAVDEMYLIAAECLARLGRDESARNMISTLLRHRITKGSLINLPTGGEALLTYILEEKRRQLVFRGTRWGDLRRLNQDVRFSKKIERHIDGASYILEPNAKKYTWPIPDAAVLYSDIIQNER